MQKKHFIVMLFVAIVTLNITAPGKSQAEDSLYVYSDGTVGIGTIDLDGTPAKGRLTVKGTTTDGTTNIIVGRNSSEANVFSVNTSGKITGLSLSGQTISLSESVTNDTSETQISSILVPTTSSSSTSYHMGGSYSLRPIINKGVTQSGYEMSFYTQALRNYYAASTDENGTLGSLYGQQITYGHYKTNTAATPVTTNAYGLYIYPYYTTGTITNMYDLFINSGTSGGTVTNRYAIYQQSTAAKNYFAGKVSIGTTSSSYPLQMASGAYVSTAGVWTDASSREYKENIRDLTEEDALTALKDLKPSRFNYKADPSDEYLGFIAEDVPDLVATEGRKGLSPMDIVAVLTKVVQKQQQEVQKQQQEIDELKNLLIEKNK